MADRIGKVSVLLQTLARIPGLSFLSSADHQMRATVDGAEDYVDEAEEARRVACEARDNAKDLARRDDD